MPRVLLRSTKVILALLVGVLLTAAILSAIEFSLRAFREETVRSVYRRSKAYIESDGWMGYRFMPDEVVRVTKLHGSEVLYDVVYRSDAFGRRLTPRSASTEPERFAVFLGGSFTLGEGVHENETLPYYFAEELPVFRGYNYGFHGYGPQHMLLTLARPDLRRELPEPDGIFIYNYLHLHPNRAHGAMSELRWMGPVAQEYPYLFLDRTGTLQRNGSLGTGRARTTRAYQRLGRLALLETLGIDLPVFWSARSRYRLVCEMIKAGKEAVGQRFPQSRFVVLVSNYVEREDGLVETCLVPEEVPYLDLRTESEPAEDHFIAIDGHPSALGYRALAKALSEGLEQAGLWGAPPPARPGEAPDEDSREEPH